MILNNDELCVRIYRSPSFNRVGLIPRQSEKDFKDGSGASIDLRLGRWFRTMKQSNLTEINPSSGKVPSKEHYVRFKNSFVIHPGKFVLGITLEWLRLPFDLAGHVTGKSSLGRRGLIIETAAGVQPGFAGCLTLELANVGEVPIRLNPGMPICQLFLHQTTSPKADVRSRFKGARKPSLD